MVTFEYSKNKMKYYTFLILTDGSIHDIDSTIDCIVESSSLPISIIIIGVGNANFSLMNFLDADEEPLFSQSLQKVQERDNVQFVEFNKYKNNPHLLARETLEELPKQMIEFYKKRNITPDNLRATYVDMEARDYFSSQGMEFIGKADQMYYAQDFVSGIVNEGIPDTNNLYLEKCAQGYTNPLR